MKTIVFGLILAALSLANVCYAQQRHFESVTNFFKLNQEYFRGVTLSISMTNHHLMSGQNLQLKCQVKNLSTNALLLFGENRYLHSIYITNSVGKNYQLAPNIESGPNNVYGYGMTRDLKAGEVLEWSESFGISTNVESGIFELYASQCVISPDCRFRWLVISNPLKIEVE